MAISLEGRPALGWSGVQQRYYEWLGGRRSGLRWLTALIQKLWDIAWDMWDNRNRVLHEQEHSAHATYHNRLQMSSIWVQPVSPQLRSSIFERTPDSPPTTTGLSNGMAHSNTSGTGTCRTTHGPRQAQQRNTFNWERWECNGG
jgi:hypothetical protein